ncbi:MAG: VanZ family protein [Bacteroidales bacterium]|nr:VanZ family protein [Bacteroidales bacterium]
MLKQLFSLPAYLRYSAFITYMILITVLSLRDDLPDPVQKALQFDLVLHFGAYLVFSFFILWAIQPKNPIYFWGIAVFSMLYGFLMEYFQYTYTNTRIFSFPDMLANVLGVVTGAFIFMLFLRFLITQNQ